MKTAAKPLPSLSAEVEHDKALQPVTEALDRVNEAIIQAVNEGISVELVLSSRYHDGRGNWGDQMATTLRKTGI